MKRSFLVISTILFVAFLSVSAVAAKPDDVESGWPMRRGRMHRGAFRRSVGRVGIILRLKEKLELADEQVTKLEAVLAEVKAGNEAVQAKRTALHEAVKSGADKSAIRAAATELGNAIGDQAVLRVGTKAEIDGILTDAQKTKLEELKQERQQRPEEKGKAWKGRDTEMVFARIDTDDDGVISLEEFKVHMERMKERRGGESTGQRGRRHRPGF